MTFSSFNSLQWLFIALRIKSELFPVTAGPRLSGQAHLSYSTLSPALTAHWTPSSLYFFLSLEYTKIISPQDLYICCSLFLVYIPLRSSPSPSSIYRL